MPTKYIKKPVIIEAVCWTGENRREIWDFCTLSYINYEYVTMEPKLFIQSSNGPIEVSIGNYIGKDIDDQYFTCSPDEFNESYEIYSNPG